MALSGWRVCSSEASPKKEVMEKKRIIYSLTTRGFFSELNNLVLAKVYADWHGMELVINTKNWNARIKEGWNDYFKNTLACRNDFFTAQLKIYSKEKPWIGKIYYNPKEFFTFYFYYYANFVYSLFHPHTELAKEVFAKMCSVKFVKGALGRDCLVRFSLAFRELYQYNARTEAEIARKKRRLGLPQRYMGVHIRRGDKIISGEMEKIDIGAYISEIEKRKYICRHVYIATDDLSSIQQLKEALLPKGFYLYYNEAGGQQGFDEKTFNGKGKDERYADTLNVLLDMDVLIHSCFFIGTYSSNLSRVVPIYLGMDNCISLDRPWDLLYR